MIDVPVLVKEALREGIYLKEYNFTVYEADGETVDFVIDNDNLVSESVKFDERMCSDTNLKFGLCEGTSLEFQAFEIPNITGRRIYAVVKAQYKNEQGSLAWYSIPMGWFTVDETSRQASTGIRKVSAYNKLKSEYLNEKANATIEEVFGHMQSVYAIDIVDALLDEYRIDQYISSREGIIETGIGVNDELTTYHYNFLYGRNGVFSPGLIMQQFKTNGWTFTTSSNTLIRPVVDILIYKFTTNDYPVRVRFSEDFDVIDTAIYNLIRNSIVVTLSDYQNLISYLFNHRWDDTSYTSPCGWFLHAEVVYTNNTVEYYGNSFFGHASGVGTFADLNLITLDNVKEIRIVIPHQITIAGVKNGNWGTSGLHLGSSTDHYYYYEDSSGYASDDLKTVTINTPCFENGDTIMPIQNTEQRVDVYQVLNLSNISMEPINIQTMADVTLRDLQSSIYETVCQYGKLDRVTDLFSGVELNNSRLYPADNLYPANNLYPNSTSERSNPAMYSKLWADEGNVRSFRYLIITYKGTELDGQGNPQEVEKRLQRTVNQNGTDDYNMSDNWLFKNLVWDDADIADYADAMVAKMQDITWFPFEMWCAGLPYIETGDELEINMSEGAYTSYVLKRNLKGIQNLQDEMMNGNLDIF